MTFSTFPYFGDGAGAVLLQSTHNEKEGIIETILKTDGSGADLIQVPAGGTMLPFGKMENEFDKYFKMTGREVFDFAVNRGSEIITDLMDTKQPLEVKMSNTLLPIRRILILFLRLPAEPVRLWRSFLLIWINTGIRPRHPF